MIYVNTHLELDVLAERLRDLLNIPLQNQRHAPQKRHSVDQGGAYYCLETFGLVLQLARPAREARGRFENFDYGIRLESESTMPQAVLTILAEYLCRLFRQAGLDAQVEYGP